MPRGPTPISSSNESNPELGLSPEESPNASIDESYPYYIVGDVGTAQSEMRM